MVGHLDTLTFTELKKIKSHWTLKICYTLGIKMVWYHRENVEFFEDPLEICSPGLRALGPITRRERRLSYAHSYNNVFWRAHLAILKKSNVRD